MANYNDYTIVLDEYNFTNQSVFPNTYIAPAGGIYTFGYNFLVSTSAMIISGSYDTDIVGQNLDGTSKVNLEYDTFEEFESDQKHAAEIVMGASSTHDYTYSVFFGDVANVTFEEDIDPSSAHMTFGQADFSDDDPETTDSHKGGWVIGFNPSIPAGTPDANYSQSYNEGVNGDVWLNESWVLGWADSDEAYSPQFYTILHEIGHSMGLAHSKGSGIDNLQFTIMSDVVLQGMVDGSDFAMPAGLQLFDILAVQKIYGSKNYDKRSEATTYSEGGAFDDGPFMYTIWDGGGVDVIDASGYEDGVKIDLRQGEFSSIGLALDDNFAGSRGEGLVDNNVAVAFHTVIENAIGTAEDDTIVGNGWSNTLIGGDGNDTLYGDGVLFDGATGYQDVDNDDPNDPNRTRPYSDIDYLDGGDGDDTIYVGQGGIDYVDGGTSTDDNDTLIIGQDLNYWTGKGVQVGGMLAVGSDHHFSENIETYRVKEGVGGYFVIHELGNTFDNISASNFIHTTFNYRNYTSALEFNLDYGFASDGTNSDYYSNYGGIVGTNHGDTYYLTENHSYVHVFSGTGDDEFLGTTTAPKQVFYSGGHDVAEDKIAFTLPIGIDLSDLAFTVTDPRYTHPDPANGRFYWTADLILTVGTLGTITYDNQIVWYDDYDDFQYGIEEVIPNIYVQLEDGVHAILPDYDPIYPYGTPIPAAFAINDLYGVSGSAFWGTWGNDTFSFHDYDNDYGDDVYFGMGGDDVITTANRDMQVWAGEGDDTILFSGAFSSYAWTLSDHLTFTRGGADIEVWSAETFHFSDNVTLTSTELETSIQGSASTETLVGNGSRNLIMSQGGDDELSGLAGDDVLDGGDGHDIIHGGDDEDYLIGGAGDDVLNGDDDDDTLYGGSGSDELNGGNGADFLVGGTGDDLLAGGAGDDAYVYSIGDGYDEITEEGGFDSVLLGAGITEGDLVFSRVGNDLLISSAVLIADFYSGDQDAIVEEIRFSDNSTLDLTELLPIFGTSGDDNLNGNAYGNFIYGLAGYDELHGGDGDDVLDGGDDDDSLYGGDGDDTLYGGDGNDYAYYSVSFFDTTVTEDSGVVTIVSEEGTDTLHDVEAFAFSEVTMPSFAIPMFTDGTSIADFMFGSSGTDIINGRGGNDTIHGYEGVDILGGGDGNDVIYGGEDSDILSGGDGDDELYANTDSVFTDLYAGNSLYGGAGNDLLVGSDSYDYLFGGDGNDTLIGMGNGDHYYGGAGADTFVFMTTDELSIYDFDAYDKLDLSALLTAFDPLTDLIADFVSFATDSTNSTMSVDRDGTGTVEDWVQIAFMADAVVSTNAQDHLTNGVLIV